MSTETLRIVGQVAGIGGIGLGILFLLYRDVIRLKVFPELTKRQAYSIIVLLLILIWSIALFGVAAWVWVEVRTENAEEIRDSSPKEVQAPNILGEPSTSSQDQTKDGDNFGGSKDDTVKKAAKTVTPTDSAKEIARDQERRQDEERLRGEEAAYITCRLRASQESSGTIPASLWIDGITYRVASDAAVHNITLHEGIPKEVRVRCEGQWRDARLEAQPSEICIIHHDC